MPYNQKSDVWSLGCILYEMVTLRHAFDSNSMKGLVLKILRGTYPEIPSHYSQDLKDLISEMLIKDPARRPSIRKVVEKEFLASRISQLLSNTVAKHEFSDTFLKKHILPLSENKENDDESETTKKGAKKSSKKKYAHGDGSLSKKSEDKKSETPSIEGNLIF
jgi:serine/threonine protein kinase